MIGVGDPPTVRTIPGAKPEPEINTGVPGVGAAGLIEMMMIGGT